MPAAELIVVAHLASTLFMVGVIWFVQVVHYPLFAAVGLESFTSYESRHVDRTTRVVSAPMLVELLSAVALLSMRPEGVSEVSVWVGIGLLAVIWTSTLALQVPAHSGLAEGFHDRSHRRLVATNWIRTGAWTLRAWLALTMTLAMR